MERRISSFQELDQQYEIWKSDKRQVALWDAYEQHFGNFVSMPIDNQKLIFHMRKMLEEGTGLEVRFRK